MLIKRFIWFILVAAASGTLSATTVLESGPGQVELIELYTSQGCNSCPPAQRRINQLLEAEGLWRTFVPVAFHVDYWNYLGWRDPYSSSGASARQTRYLQSGGIRSAYTPEFVRNGREWRGWRLSAPSGDQPRSVGVLRVEIDDRELKAQYDIPAGEYQLNYAILGFGIRTAVHAGENRDRTLAEEFTALNFGVAGETGRNWTLQLPDVPNTGESRRGLAVWVSRPGDPAPLQATGGWLP